MALLIAQNLEPHNPSWYDEVYHSGTYVEAFANPSPDLTTVGNMSVDEMLPPNHKRGIGRPKSKRYVSTSDGPRTCHSCGNVGHFASTCAAPDTEYTYRRNEQRAMNWANSFVNKIYD
jgi:hypothetical protein